MGGHAGAGPARARGLQLRAWRLVHARWEKSAFTGEGAALFPGRWNQRGERAVYLAGSLALAVLETRVHLEAPDVEAPYVAIEVEIADADVVPIDTLVALAPNWEYDLAACAEIGSDWLRSGRSLALSVPSAIVPVEKNLILNPDHPRAERLHIARVQPSRLRPRPRSRRSGPGHEQDACRP